MSGRHREASAWRVHQFTKSMADKTSVHMEEAIVMENMGAEDSLKGDLS